jgi:hypothetical protein
MQDMVTAAMSGTLTVRLSGPALPRVRARARSLGLTSSALVRALLERETGPLEGEPAALELTRRWVGAVRTRRVAPGRSARRTLAEWNPDRRG